MNVSGKPEASDTKGAELIGIGSDYRLFYSLVYSLV
jgi:hypothetical protein